MYELKTYPQDFIVKEISYRELKNSGKYSICLLKKTNYTTIRAIEQLAKSLKKSFKDISFAGTKDKKAITEQYISIKNVKKEKIKNLHLKDIEMNFLGYSDKPISLGNLEGNEFIITIRNLKKQDIKKLEEKTKQIMPNFFGEQRFSTYNIKIGKLLLQSEFKEAIQLIIDSNSDYKGQIQSFLKNNPNNFTAALQIIPKKLLRLYIHSYQSYLWNKTLYEYMKISKKNTQIPIIGFGTEIKNKELIQIIIKIMQNENITFRDFINRKIHELSSEGNFRDAFIEIKNLRILEKKENTLKINFALQKGAYATIAIAYLFNSFDTVI